MKTKFARLPRGTIPPTHGFIITYNQHTGETAPLRVGIMARYIFIGLKKMFDGFGTSKLVTIAFYRECHIFTI